MESGVLKPRLQQSERGQYLNADDLWLKDKRHCIHPWTDFSEFPEHGSTIISHAEGVYVFDSEGNRFLDGIGGLWCVNIGYGREEMAEAAAQQIRTLPQYSFFGNLGNPPAAELAAKISTLAPPHLNHVFYSTGGSTANDTAVRIAHFYFHRLGKPQKRLVISRDEAYHGSTYLSAALTGIVGYHDSFHMPENIVHYVSAPNLYRKPDEFNSDQYRDWLTQEFEDKINQLGADNVACFIAEPIMGAGGVLVAPEGYHENMQDICRKYNILYISDEVVTAFGRLGEFFASEKIYRLSPDIITSAKGLSSGYLPLGATIISDNIYDVIATPKGEDGLFAHGFTYSGHPVCCAVALKNLEIMQRENICAQVRKTGRYFEQKLRDLQHLPLVGDVRGSHFMMCMEYVGNKRTKEPFASAVKIGSRIAHHCQAQGLIVRPLGHYNVLSPPLILSEAQIDAIAEILQSAIHSTSADLRAENIDYG